MDKITVLRNQHAELATSLLQVFRKHEFLRVERWADPEGIADTLAADLIKEVADLVDAEWHLEGVMKVLEKGDIFAVRTSDECFLLLAIMGTSAKVLDLTDFQERHFTIIRNREYVVWGHIREED